MTPSNRLSAAGAPDEGSAFLVALLGLLVLTAIGLTLGLVTQTESQLGDNERSAKRVFYAAESGFAPSISRAILAADYSPHLFTMPELEAPAGFAFRNDVDVSPFYPILAVPCNLCQINNAGSYGEKQYLEVTHAVTAQASRRTDVAILTGPLARKSVSVMVDIQPAEAPAEAHFALLDPEQINKVRF